MIRILRYFVLTLLLACNDIKEKSSLAIPDSTQKVTNTVGKDVRTQDELGKNLSFPVDSLQIRYEQIADTLFGYRSDDTLTVEGDMKFIYAKGTKRAVGTTWHQWATMNEVVIIPYAINSQYKYPHRIFEAFKMWGFKVKINFLPRDSQIAYIEFVPSNITRSFVGKTGARQTIELEEWAKPGNIAHEIGHALGLYHEQSRSDRDSYVNIACSNDINFRHAYKKDPYARDIGAYNFYSIMHYGPSECMSMKVQNLPGGIPGQRDSISGGDYGAVALLYHLH